MKRRNDYKIRAFELGQEGKALSESVRSGGFPPGLAGRGGGGYSKEETGKAEKSAAAQSLP